MKLRSARVAVISGFGLALFVSPALRAQGSQARPLYLDVRQPLETRVDDLLNRMTLKEKVGQLNLPCVYVNQLGKDIPGE